jgi:cyanate permease
MENLLVKLMLTAAIAQLGISVSDVLNPEPKSIKRRFERRSKDILQINWQPISVFPEDSRRFR